MQPSLLFRLFAQAKPVVVQLAKTVAADPMFVQLVVNVGKSIFTKQNPEEPFTEPTGMAEDGSIVLTQFIQCPTCHGHGKLPYVAQPGPETTN